MDDVVQDVDLEPLADQYRALLLPLVFDEYNMQDDSESYAHTHHFNQNIMEVSRCCVNSTLMDSQRIVSQPCGDIRVKLTRLLKENQSWIGTDGSGTNLPLHPNASIFIRSSLCMISLISMLF